MLGSSNRACQTAVHLFATNGKQLSSLFNDRFDVAFSSRLNESEKGRKLRQDLSFLARIVLCVVSVTAHVQAEERNPFLPAGVEDEGWPAVRGVDFDAHSPEIHLADSWPKEGPPVLWVKDLGQGYSAFVAQGNRVYTQA
ncbi:MAG: hypothetical protein KDA77_15095, partial [Planctomycetaceae bacterium]|nr:hypothetical protein [Planctomycetaceae bacterium]